jgi:hypothetical protein
VSDKPERVYTTTTYYDGPREGIADYLGVPHVYASLWSAAIDGYTDPFQLMPIDPTTFDLAMEDWAIWMRWLRAFEAGVAPPESHPALPADADRHAAIVHQLGDKLTVIPDRAITVTGRFDIQTVSDIDGNTRTQSIVYWSNVEVNPQSSPEYPDRPSHPA